MSVWTLKCNTGVYYEIWTLGTQNKFKSGEIQTRTNFYHKWRERNGAGSGDRGAPCAAAKQWPARWLELTAGHSTPREASLRFASGPISSVKSSLVQGESEDAGHILNSECSAGGFQSPKSSDQILLSFVIISTLTIWSNELQMQRPLLSGLQSKLEMGWVDNVTFCKRLTEPATPISTPSESFFDRWTGYSLKARTKKVYSVCKGKSCNYHLQNPSKHFQNGWQTPDPLDPSISWAPGQILGPLCTTLWAGTAGRRF